MCSDSQIVKQMNSTPRRPVARQWRLKDKQLATCVIILLIVLSILSLGFAGCALTKKTTTPLPTPTTSPPPTTTAAPVLSPSPKPAPKPIIVLPDGDINIGTILQKTSVQGVIELANNGDADLNISRVDGPSFFQCKSAMPITIPPGKTAKLEFSIDTREAKPLDGILHFQTNDLYTKKQDLYIRGDIDPISITTKERQEQYLQTVAEAQPQYLTVTDLGRKSVWRFQPIPSYSCDWSLKIFNSGPGNAHGTLTVLASKGGNPIKNSMSFHLSSKEETSLKFNLPVNFLKSIFGGYDYSYQFSNITEEHLRARTMLDIYRVTKSGAEKLDSFPKDSEKSQKWQETDYYKPDSIVFLLTLYGGSSVVTTTPTPQPILPTPSTSAVQTPAPTVTLAPPTFDLQVSNIQENHSGIFTVSINIQAHAQLTNNGDMAAHNIKAKVQAKAKSNGQVLNINGQNTYTVNLGNLSGKKSLEHDLSLSMQVGMSTALDLQNNGITFQIDVVSDETQKTFTYDYPQ